MVMVGEYADTLRALGRYLDGVGASEIAIIEERNDLGIISEDQRHSARGALLPRRRAARASHDGPPAPRPGG